MGKREEKILSNLVNEIKEKPEGLSVVVCMNYKEARYYLHKFMQATESAGMNPRLGNNLSANVGNARVVFVSRHNKEKLEGIDISRSFYLTRYDGWAV